MKSELAQQGKMSSTLNALRKQGKVFGVGEALIKQVDEALKKYESNAAYWAQDTYEDMEKSAPIWSGNLKRSLMMDDTNYPEKTFVGVDVGKMTARAGQRVGPDISLLHRGDRGYTFPDEEYTEDADRFSTTSNNYKGGPFIEEVWYEQGKKHAKKYFKGCKIKNWKE